MSEEAARALARIASALERISPPPQAAPAPPPPAAPAADPIAQLKELGELRDSGVLTEAEFEAQKAKILG